MLTRLSGRADNVQARTCPGHFPFTRALTTPPAQLPPVHVLIKGASPNMRIEGGLTGTWEIAPALGTGFELGFASIKQQYT